MSALRPTTQSKPERLRIRQMLSALPPKAVPPDLRNTPAASSWRTPPSRPRAVSLFDHLVGKREHLVRNIDAERIRGLEVDHQLEFGRLHDRQVGNLFPLQNPAGVDTDLTVGVGKIGSVTNETTSHSEFALHVNRGHCMSRCQRDDLIALADEERIAGDDECTNPLLHKRCEGGIDLARRACLENDQVAPDSMRGHLRLSNLKFGTRIVRIDEQAYRRNGGH